MSETAIRDGVEEFEIPGRPGQTDVQCARCGSSVEWVRCWDCGGDGFTHHDCGEDCCACLYPEDNVPCRTCEGKLGRYHCLSSPEWCQAHPLAGREHIDSTALSSQSWGDVS